MRLQELPVRRDARGNLVPLEPESALPFAIARVCYLYGMDADARRGRHAHRTTTQFAICVAGGCTFHVDDGGGPTTIRLDRPDRGLLLPPGLWREMSDFTPGCVVMLLADRRYDEDDYITDYAEFLGAAAARAA
ncbi:MAG: FdtA/QdtA family cupin domain-containing protein [Alphaproteobacteria bacterium]|nr:FdtA/QdtA family cupin domain-containing protein [Alphaproteobacteria bacterium]